MHEIKMIAVPGNKPSVVGSIEVKPQEKVAKEQDLFTIETAKGKRTIKSDVDGMVAAILVEIGEEVKAGQTLMQICMEEKTVEDIKKSDKDIQEKEFDIVVIGGGPGGYVAAIYAAMNGKKVALVEKGKLGGTCLNVGCIPTKALIESADLYHRLHNAKELGIKVENISFDFAEVMARKNKVVSTLQEGIHYLMKKHKIEVIDGQASFRDDRSIIAGDFLLHYQDCIIATGSKQASVNIKGIEHDCVITSDQALAMEKLPKSITIIGGGVIGMEFAFILNSFGVEVQIVEYMERILSGMDEEATGLLQEIAEQRGIKFHLAAKAESIEKTENGMAVLSYRKGEKLCYLASEKILLAIGRTPNTDGLHIEKANIKMEKNAIVIDEFMRTNIEHIYAIGDVTNIMQLAHVASHQGVAAVDHIMGKEHKMNYQAVPAVVFTHPEIASVGVLADPEKHISSRFDFSGNGKALVMRETEGFVKLIKDKESNALVGATIIGPDASVMINTVTLAIGQKLSEAALAQMIFPHPTTGEALHEAALEFGLGALHQ